MGPSEANLPLSKKQLRRIRDYIAVRIPLVPEGYKIVVDKTAFDALLQEALSANRSLKDRLRQKETSLPPKKLRQLKGALLNQFNSKAGHLPFHVSELENEAAETKRTLIMAGPIKLTQEGYTEEEKMQIFKEWFCIRHALVKAGAHLEVLSASSEGGGFREVYTRDRYVMIGDTAFLPDPQKLQHINDSKSFIERLPQHEVAGYQREIAQIEKALKERGIRTVTVDGAWFEGGNVVRHYSSQTIFVGLGPDYVWNSEESAEKLVAAINRAQNNKWSLLSVPLTNEDMYHMDTGMSEELPHGEVLLSPLVTDKKTYEKICNIVGPQNVIKLSNTDAFNLATNMIDVGNTLIMTGNCRKVREQLVKKGYTVVMPEDYGQPDFEFGAGGVHCMTNDVRQIKPKKKTEPAPR